MRTTRTLRKTTPNKHKHKTLTIQFCYYPTTHFPLSVVFCNCVSKVVWDVICCCNFEWLLIVGCVCVCVFVDVGVIVGVNLSDCMLWCVFVDVGCDFWAIACCDVGICLMLVAILEWLLVVICICWYCWCYCCCWCKFGVNFLYCWCNFEWFVVVGESLFMLLL